MLFLPRQVKPALAGDLVQGVRFNLVENLVRSSLRGYQVVPAPRHVAGRIELQDAGGQGVAAPKVVEQPAVKPGFPEGLLDGGNTVGGLHGERVYSTLRRAVLCVAMPDAFRITFFFGPEAAPDRPGVVRCVFNVKKRSWKGGVQVTVELASAQFERIRGRGQV